MQINLAINGEKKTLSVLPHERLLRVLRREGYFSVKFGDEQGLTGASTVLMDGQPINAQTMLAAQADGHAITTLEGIGSSRDLHPLQQAFIDTGAIQSGYCTPAQILVAYALLKENLNPTEKEVRAALSSILDRETGYLKVVQAILRAAAVMRGEAVPPFEPLERAIPAPPGLFESPWPFDTGDSSQGGDEIQTQVKTIPAVVVSPPDLKTTHTIGKPEPKVDAVKLAAGKPVYADDIEMRGMLHAALLTSPHAHARIVAIDTSKAKALPGVQAVLTYKDVPRVYYASGGQS